MGKSQKFLLSFYGDDFTGSTDSMEALTINGIKTILFLDVPDPQQLEDEFDDYHAFGVAGVGRSFSPDEMELKVRPVLKRLKEFQTPIVHYKMCSTFDSSPEIGSIGKIVDIGRELFSSQRIIPLLVGAPTLKRYTVFGNHFASVRSNTFRLDRHPTMSRHPVTPMIESDLIIHLSKQTSAKLTLMDILSLDLNYEDRKSVFEQKIKEDADVLLYDVLNNQHIQHIGELIWEETNCGQQFVIGSSGVEYALSSYWQKTKQVNHNFQMETTSSVEQMLVVAGSCSPVTQSQILWALKNGFAGLKVSTEKLINPDQKEEELRKVYDEALYLLSQGKSLIIYTALGPDDPSINITKNELTSKGFHASDTGKLLGKQLGNLVKELLIKSQIKRVVIAGGDTSGYATKELGIYALEMIMPIAPGTPLCRAFSNDVRFNGLEIALKGGQNGQQDFFCVVHKGCKTISETLR